MCSRCPKGQRGEEEKEKSAHIRIQETSPSNELSGTRGGFLSEPGHPEKQGEEGQYQHGLRSLLKSCIGSLSDLEWQELGASQGVGELQPWGPIISKETLSVGSREAVVGVGVLVLGLLLPSSALH